MEESSRQRLLRDVGSSSKLLISLAQCLLAAPSPNPPGDVSAVAAQAKHWLTQHVPNAEVQLYPTSDTTVNLVAIVKSPHPGKRLVFNGHMDTYPSGEEDQWTYPPFQGTLTEGSKRLYGRGSCDMKGGIAASMIAFWALANCVTTWSGELVLTLAGDEETMGVLGTQYLIQNVDQAVGDAMVCGDAGSPRVVRVGEKGLVWLKVQCQGKSAHGAHVHLGINAIDRLRKALDRIKMLDDLRSRNASAKEVSNIISSASGISEKISGSGEEETLTSITVNIGSITGGTTPNLVPDTAEAMLDIRLPIGVSVADIKEFLLESLGHMEGVSYEIIRSYEPSFTSPAEAIVQKSLSASSEILGTETTPNIRVGASDARLYRAAGIPSVVLGLTPHNMGGVDEYVETEELSQLAQIHALIAFDFLRQGQ